MKEKILFPVVFCLVFLAGCQKDEPSREFFPEVLKQYVLFDEGSYWIYRNINSGKEDSTILKEGPYLVFNREGESGPDVEYFLSQYGGTFLLSTGGGPDPLGLGFSVSYRFKGNVGSHAITSENLVKGFKKTSEEYKYSYSVLSTNDTLNIDSTYYTNVLVTQVIDFARPDLDSITYTYYFDNVHGLVKYSRQINGLDSVWILVKSHTVR